MKIRSLLLTCICAITGLSASAQVSGLFYVQGLLGPSHPLNPYNVRIKADTIRHGSDSPCSGADQIITHSADGLTDTVYILSCALVVKAIRYNEKEQIVYIISNAEILTTEYPWDIGVTEYEYDSQGRVSKKTERFINILGKDSIVSEINYDYSTVQYTEKGYIFDDWEYELDDMKRVTYMKWLPISSDQSVVIEDGTYQSGGYYYSYSDSSVSIITYERVRYDYSEQKNIYEANKSVYYFNKEGYTSFIKKYVWDGESWQFNGESFTEYIYTSRLDNTLITSSATTVYGISGAIVINTSDRAQVCVYNVVGQIVKRQQTGAGIVQIALPKGLYFVTVDERSYKTLVR